jgi:hypothetical protein
MRQELDRILKSSLRADAPVTTSQLTKLEELKEDFKKASLALMDLVFDYDVPWLVGPILPNTTAAKIRRDLDAELALDQPILKPYLKWWRAHKEASTKDKLDAELQFVDEEYEAFASFVDKHARSLSQEAASRLITLAKGFMHRLKSGELFRAPATTGLMTDPATAQQNAYVGHLLAETGYTTIEARKERIEEIIATKDRFLGSLTKADAKRIIDSLEIEASSKRAA